ncbi:hypothetical protein [Aeromicrobium sp. Root236]|uniref:hypothetical protein n=1 Tax=Aeromicrobium sp. Root236 TaxID=1736498 RepID=UPI000A984785|nr:hypothetical protein [Aeromicrobium sp. Root236]
MSGLRTPSDADPYSLAEFIESWMLISAEPKLSNPELRGLFPAGQEPSDIEFSDGRGEIERRSDLMGSGYPYAVSSRGVERRTSNLTAVYDFLLLMSLKDTPVRIEKSFHRSDAIFDAVVREAARARLGKTAVAIDFGYPPRNGRPTDFSKAVSWVGDLIGVGDRDLDRPGDSNDDGVDVIAWDPVGDGRVGFPVYLIQNTVRMDYAKKPKDIVPARWVQWLRLPKEPHTGFAVPFAIPVGDDRWPEITTVADLPFDRVRLLMALAGSDPTAWAEYAAIESFNTIELRRIRSDDPATSQLSVARPRKPKKAYEDVRDRRSR